MRIIVKCFAGCRDAVGATSVSVELPAGTTVGEAFAGLIESYPALAGYDRSVMLAVNREYADRQVVLEEGDELACIPPVSGGAPPMKDDNERVYKITTDKIEPDALFEWGLKPHHGAVVTFAGTVRDNTDGRRTLRLEYETYAEMAEAKMQEVGDEIRERWGIKDVAMIHRVGTLEIGEISILISVAAPHRKNAFEACSYAIDRVKQIVPVWKKEIWADGEREWVERQS